MVWRGEAWHGLAWLYKKMNSIRGELMSYAIRWIASKQFLFIDFLFLVVFGLALYFAWPSMPAFSRYLAMAMTATMIALLFVGVVFLAGQAFFTLAFTHKKRDIDIRVYEQSQLGPLPLSSLSSSKISEVEPEPQKLQGAKRRIIKSLPPSKSQRRKFAIGVRNGSPSIAKIASANLQDDYDENLQDDMDANSLDDIDRKIIEAYANLRSQNRKPTGIAIANMTGVAQRTVYDRAEKIRGRGTVL
jgi:hypothetical protein